MLACYQAGVSLLKITCQPIPKQMFACYQTHVNLLAHISSLARITLKVNLFCLFCVAGTIFILASCNPFLDKLNSDTC